MTVFSDPLIVYYRESCHLCKHVVASLFQLQVELKYEIKQIDIDDESKVSTEVRAKYNADVPVVMYKDEVVFYHIFDEVAVREALAN